MLEIKPNDQYIQIGDKIVLHQVDASPPKGKINLYLQRWDDIPSFVGDKLIINYPWEYDQDGIYIKVFDVEGDLNYLINYDGEFISILQNEEALESVEEVDNMDRRLVLSSQVAKKLEELDTWWEIIKI